jgi:hypothetical protein
VFTESKLQGESETWEVVSTPDRHPKWMTLGRCFQVVPLHFGHSVFCYHLLDDSTRKRVITMHADELKAHFKLIKTP